MLRLLHVAHYITKSSAILVYLMKPMMSSSQTTTLHSRRALYVGGLDPAVKHQTIETTLRAAFLPFGPIHNIEIPMDYAAGTHKGFAFLEFVDGEDAAEAIYNMDGSELFGKTLTVNIAQAEQMNLGSNKAVWSTEEWFKEQSGMKEDEDRNFHGKNKETVAT
jgi:peptidyl-prolyl isomerase E (cyclophilin E)